ncbi:MAG: hypothetical protein LBU65_17630 [Planctomycetaceae bacterium]|jgi:hypothetical protein|nr:hypothetical protein [Planctomycetaceae bacterium]
MTFHRNKFICAAVVIMLCVIMTGCKTLGKGKQGDLTNVLSENEIKRRAEKDPFPRADQPATPNARSQTPIYTAGGRNTMR